MTSYIDSQYWDGSRQLNSYPKRLIRMLIRRFFDRPALTVLELGPGTGDFTEAWRSVGCSVETMDREQVFPDTHIVDIEREAWARRVQPVDLVFHKNLIEHVTDPHNLMDQTLMALKPGGLLIVMCPDWRTYMKTFYDDYTHVRPYDVKSLGDLLKVWGFQNVTCERIYQYPPIWDHNWLRPLAFTWRLLVPVEASLWLSNRTGIGFFRWSAQLTLLASGTKAR